MQNFCAKTLVDVRSGPKFAKSPRWIGQKLLFLDVHDRRVMSVDLEGSVEMVTALPFVPGFIESLPDGVLIIGEAFGRKVYRLDAAGLKLIADLSVVARFYLNDGIFDRRGGIYVSDVGFDFLDPFVDPLPQGVIVHANMDGRLTVVAENLFFPGGMIITPDNRTLVVAEALGNRLTAFDIRKDGSLGNRRVWAQFQSDIRPDGICLDKESGVWVAGSGLSAVRVREGGEIDQQIATTKPVFDVALGGLQRNHLFLCTSVSNDPVVTRQVPNATIDISNVAIPGIKIPDVNLSTGIRESHLSGI